MKTILVTGAGGQVGNEFAIAGGSAHRIVACSRAHLDIADPVSVAEAFTVHRPDIVINAAAYTQVDRAEQEQKLAFSVNREGPARLAEACHERGIPLLHISTDYVFDGSKRGAYVESDPIAPLGVYGESKAAGEAMVRESLAAHLILRTSWVFSATGNNFVKTMLGLGRERDQLGIVDDQHGCPTSARSIAGVLLEIAGQHFRGEAIEWGTYHYCNQPATTWYGFAREIFRLAPGYDELVVRPIETRDYPTPARRPANSTLDCSKLRQLLRIEQVGWLEELEAVVKSLGIEAG